MNLDPIRIGTRGSQLALWQANHVAALLRAIGHTVEIEVIRTSGDRLQNASLDGLSPNGTGIFIKEIEDALLAGRIDLAVHSLKDLPTQPTPGLTLAAIPARADARDAFVCERHWGLHMLPSGARVATTSPRRQAMVLALRPDLTFVEMRGNIDTRLRKWEEGACDALILASAGLDRLGRTEHVHQRFSIDEMTPAPGQGALALQVRCPDSPQICHPERSAAESKDLQLTPAAALLSEPFSHERDALIYAAVHALNDPATEYAVTTERAVLHALGGGCQLPLGAFCHKTSSESMGNEAGLWHLHAMIVSPDGEQVVQVLHKAPLGTPATEFGATVADALKARGALQLLAHDPQPQT